MHVTNRAGKRKHKATAALNAARALMIDAQRRVEAARDEARERDLQDQVSELPHA